MEITEARIKLMPSRSDRLQAFCTITIDNDFVIRDIKIIEGAKGAFVAMPSRKLTDKCPKCGGKNHLRARHCNDCGGKLDENRATKDKRGRAKLHADIAHPINSACRERIQAKIIEAFEEEVARSKEPGYVPAPLYDDEEPEESDFAHEEHAHEEHAHEEHAPAAPAPAPPAPAPAPREPEPAPSEEPEDVSEFAQEPEETPAPAPRERAPAARREVEPPVEESELDDAQKELDEINRELRALEEEEEEDKEKEEEDDAFSSGIL